MAKRKSANSAIGPKDFVVTGRDFRRKKSKSKRTPAQIAAAKRNLAVARAKKKRR